MVQGSRLMVRAAANGSAATARAQGIRSEENRMDGQGAGGFGFVVGEVISGPRESAEVAPARAVTLACLAG